MLPERSKKILGRFRGIGVNIVAALLGAVTPFCSCSSIPLFIGFTSAGLPLGVTFSFLISSPMVDLGSLILLMSMDTGIDHVKDFLQIAAYGVMTTPALVVDGKVVSYGKVLKKGEVIPLIQKARS